MRGTITLWDGGQDYIEFDITNNVIMKVRPAKLAGWKGTRVLNKTFKVGGPLIVDLQWDTYDLTLKYPISKIEIKSAIPHRTIAEGTTTGRKRFYLIDAGGNFLADGVRRGDTVRQVKKGKTASVISVEIESEVEISKNMFEAGDEYLISRPIQE